MAVDGVRLDTGAPQFLGGGAPAITADPNAMMLWVSSQFKGTVAAIANLDSVTSDTPLYDGCIRKVTAVPGCLFLRVAGAWQMIGTAVFATAAARDSAIPTPATGWRSRIADELFDRVYRSSSWRPDAAIVPIKPTVAGSGVTVNGEGLIAMAAASAINITGLAGFRKVRVQVEVVSASANNQLTCRVRSASDDSSANYFWQVGAFNNTTAAAVAATSQTLWSGMQPQTTQTYSLEFEIEDLDVARQTRVDYTANVFLAGSHPRKSIGTLWHGASTAWSGITLATDTGTVTGTVRVYGIT